MTRRHATARSFVAVLCLALGVAGCGEGDSTDGSPASTPSFAPASASVDASPSEPASTPDETDEPVGGDVPALALDEVATGLSAPVNVASTSDGWLFVNEQAGRVIAVEPRTGAADVTLDITDRVGSNGSEQGLLGLAFHPDWPADPRAFVDYTDRNGDTVVSELRVSAASSPPRLDPTTERILLQVEQPYANHNGGQLAFGPDGYLYVALGDGGSGGDPHGHGQDATTLLGSILRIDVDGGDPYGVPDDNPFANGADGAPEVFLFGLRNPWRFSFDRDTGLLWVADVGQDAVEEIDRIDPATEGGANLGWNVMEASHCFSRPSCATDGLMPPVAEYGHDQGCSVTGGYVYRGAAVADLDGWYLFSDVCSGTLFGIPSDVGGVVAPRTLLDTNLAVSTFGEDADGELYLADLEGGTLYRIVAAP